MFENIDEKLKKFAQVIFWIEVVGTVIAAIILFVAAGNSYYSKGLYKTWGWILLIAGPISAWVSNAFLYGFAELIKNSAILARSTKNNSIPQNYVIDAIPTSNASVPQQTTKTSQPLRKCSSCGKMFEADYRSCPHCGYRP